MGSEMKEEVVSLLYMCTTYLHAHCAQHTYRIVVRKTTIICLGRQQQQTHKTFRFISHHHHTDFLLFSFLSFSLKLFFLFILFNRLIHLTINTRWCDMLLFSKFFAIQCCCCCCCFFYYALIFIFVFFFFFLFGDC